MIAIRDISDSIILEALVLKEAISHEELMASDYLKLEWTSSKKVILPAGAYIKHNGERYSLFEPYSPERKSEAEYRYAPIFHSRIMFWDKVPACIYTYEDDGITIKSREFDWDFMGAPEDALFIVLQAIKNETGEEWTYSIGGGLPETIAISSQSSSVFSILSGLAEQCKTEWWTEKSTNVLYLSKCVRGQKLSLSVGVNIKAPTVNGSSDGYYTRYYAFGGTRNISQDPISSKQIINRRLTLDPMKYPGGFKDTKGHFENGVFVSDLEHGEVFSKPIYFDDVFPSSALAISNVRKRLKYRLSDGNKIVIGNGEQGDPIYETYAIWYFQVSEMNFSEDLIIEGQNLSVLFKDGQLAGKEFELKWYKDGTDESYSDDVEPFVVNANEYEVILDESTGRIIPGLDYIVPSNGDKVVFFNIKMPDEYTGAAMDELEMRLNQEIENEHKDNASYEFDSYPHMFEKNNVDIVVGQLVGFANGGEDMETRVTMVEKHLDYKYEQRIRIGNRIAKGNRKQLQEDVHNLDQEVESMRNERKIYASLQRHYAQDLRDMAARYMSVRETISMLQSAFDNFSEGINPVTVETMMMLVGDQSLQFKFVESRENMTPIDMPVSYDSTIKQLFVEQCAIVHLTLGINSIQPIDSINMSRFLKWSMASFGYDSAIILNEPNKRYYLYAKVERNGTDGIFQLSESIVKMTDEADYYYLLVGILNSEIEGTRVFVPLYGFTEISPGQITTDILRSTTGNLVIDLANAVITADKGARFIGNLTIGEDSSGLENLSEWKDKQAQIDNAQQTAADAQSAADAAQREADAAKDRLDSWAEDGVIAPVEKQGIKDEIARIDADKSHITDEFAKYKLGTPTAYNTAYSSYRERLAELSAPQPETIQIPQDFTARQKAYYDARTSSLNAISKAADDYAKTLVADSAREMQAKVDELQKQVDGVVESFSFPYTPTPQNHPASEWTTDEKKQAHVGDVFYNIQPYENADGTVNPDAGKAWRWSQDDAEHSGWHWHPIADSDAVRAMQLAQMSVLDTDVLFIQTSSQTSRPLLPAVNSSGIITNMNGWSTSAPEWKDGMYMWQVTYVRKGDGSASFSDPTCVSGKDGASVTITSQTVTYQASSSGTAVPAGTWSAAIPSVPQGQYLWTRTVVNYSDGKSTTSYSVSRQGANGSSYSNNLMANTGQRFEKTETVQGDHYYILGDHTVHMEYGKTYTMSARTNGVFTDKHLPEYGHKCVTLWIVSGASSPQGTLHKKVSGPEMTSDGTKGVTFTWTNATGEYMLRVNFYDVGTWWVEKVKIEEGAVTDTQWSPTASEMLGVTITSEEIRYAKGNYPSQPADSAFTLTSIGTLTKGQYLWTRTTVNYSDGKQTKSYTVAYIGTDGSDGIGIPGSDGKTSYVHFAYASGITGSLPNPTAVTGFKTTAFAGAKYIGVCTDFSQADPTAHTSYEWSEYRGEDGVGIAGITEQYYLSSSRTELAGGSWSDTRPAWKAGWYYWTRSKTTYTDGRAAEYTAGICVTGDAGTSVLAQYSANGSSWHPSFQPGDIYMRTSSDSGSTWTPKMPIVGSPYTPNLFMNTEFKSKGHWSFGTNVTIDSTHKHEGRNSVKSAQSGLTANSFRGISCYYSQDVKEGDVFTASIWVYAEDLSAIDPSVKLELWGYKDSSRVGTHAEVSVKPTKAKEWQQFHISHTMPATANKANLYAYVTKNGTVWFASPKLERGVNPNPVWTPAEEEMKGMAYTPNLLLKSEELIVPYSSSSNYNYKSLAFESQPEFNVGDTFSLSVENITVKQGTPDTFTALLYQHDDKHPDGGIGIAVKRHMTAEDKTALLTVTTKPTKEVKLLLYAGKLGETAGNEVTYNKIMLVHGDNPAPWSPAASEMVGKWRKWQWAKNKSATTAPTSGWQDTPMTAAAGEYVWMRSGMVVPPATEPTSWDAATRLTGDRGESGESTYLLDLSNEVTGIICNASGAVTGAYPTSQATVYKGASKLTSGVTYSIAGKSGISTAAVSAAGVVSMSGMTADTATVTVQAVVAGVTLQSTISLYKVKPGASYSENLVVKSGTEITTSAYLIKKCLVTEDLVAGEQYTLTIWGELANGKVFNVYDNKGVQFVAQPQKVADGIYSCAFVWKRSANATDASFDIYNFPSNVSGTSTIRRIKLEKGNNTSPVWSPAPDEMVGEPAVVYSILPSVDSVSRKSDGTTSVTSVTCTKYATEGSAGTKQTSKNYLYAWRTFTEGTSEVPKLIAGEGTLVGSVAITSNTESATFELRSSTAETGYTVLDRERVPVLADGADLQEQIDDIKYLESIFPKSTSVNNGATIAKILGVIKDGSTSVIAGLNGTDAGKDDTHGKLIFFGGASSITNIANATTRIYEDGTIDTSKLIARNGGQIGSFKIMGDEKFSGLMGSDEGGTIMMLGSSLDFQGHGATCIKNVTIDVKGDFIDVGNRVMALKSNFLKPSNRPSYSNTCLSLDATGEVDYDGTGGGNFAIECINGLFAGLRPNVRRISTTPVTLTEYDYMIRVTRTCTVNLPTNPKLGQRYEIINNWGANLTINGKGKNIWAYGVQNYPTSYSYQSSDVLLHILVYDGTEWIMTRLHAWT